MKLDGSVPDGGWINDHGEPGRKNAKQWHQGVIVVMYDLTGERTPEAEYVSFYNGRCVWRGEEFIARCDPGTATRSSRRWRHDVHRRCRS